MDCHKYADVSLSQYVLFGLTIEGRRGDARSSGDDCTSHPQQLSQWLPHNGRTSPQEPPVNCRSCNVVAKLKLCVARTGPTSVDLSSSLRLVEPPMQC